LSELDSESSRSVRLRERVHGPKNVRGRHRREEQPVHAVALSKDRLEDAQNLKGDVVAFQVSVESENEVTRTSAGSAKMARHTLLRTRPLLARLNGEKIRGVAGPVGGGAAGEVERKDVTGSGSDDVRGGGAGLVRRRVKDGQITDNWSGEGVDWGTAVSGGLDWI
jgi:hypothetical protein